MAGGFRVEIRTRDLWNAKLVSIRLFDDQNVGHVPDHPVGTSLYYEDVFSTTAILRLNNFLYKMMQKANTNCNIQLKDNVSA